MKLSVSWRVFCGSLIWFAAIFLPELTPARAVLLALLFAVCCPIGCVRSFLLQHGGAWLVLHFLRSDADLWIGVLILLASAALLLAARRWSWVVLLAPLLILGPLLLNFVPNLASLPASAPLSFSSPWSWANAAPVIAAHSTQTPSPPVELPASGLLASLDWQPPARLMPFPLAADSWQRLQALLLVGLLFALQGIFLGRDRRKLSLLGGSLLAAVLSWNLAQSTAPVLLHWHGAQGAVSLEVFPPGAGRWSPREGPLLAPAGDWTLKELAPGYWRPSGQSCWAILQPFVGEPASPEAVAPNLAWLEWDPLSGAETGGASEFWGLLRLWAAGEQHQDSRAVRWEYQADGSLVRRLQLKALDEVPG